MGASQHFARRNNHHSVTLLALYGPPCDTDIAVYRP
jgi:hypothetical protein